MRLPFVQPLGGLMAGGAGAIGGVVVRVTGLTVPCHAEQHTACVARLAIEVAMRAVRERQFPLLGLTVGTCPHGNRAHNDFRASGATVVAALTRHAA